MRSLLVRSLSLLLMVQLIPGCTHWSPVRDVTPEAYVAAKQPKRVRVLLGDSSRVVLMRPWVRGDTLGGQAPGRRGQPQIAGDSVLLPLAWIRQLDVRRTDVAATIGLTTVSVVVMGSAIILVWAAATGLGQS